MEAVGLVASIITLISATNGVATLLTRFWNLRSFPEYLRPASNEVRSDVLFLRSTADNITSVE